MFQADTNTAVVAPRPYARLDAPPLDAKDIERFWTKVETSDGCWLWTAARNPRGYGVFPLRGNRTLIASRISLLIASGEWKPQSLVCHKCDNPPCVRPDHLYFGSPRDNGHDMAMRGERRLRKRANVRLVNSAGQMLTALKAVEEYLVPRVEVPPHGRVGRLEILPMVRAAIAAAEGK